MPLGWKITGSSARWSDQFGSVVWVPPQGQSCRTTCLGGHWEDPELPPLGQASPPGQHPEIPHRLAAPKGRWRWGVAEHPASSPWRVCKVTVPSVTSFLLTVFSSGVVLLPSTKSLKVKISVSCWLTSERLCAALILLWRVFILPPHSLICICHSWTSRMAC